MWHASISYLSPGGYTLLYEEWNAEVQAGARKRLMAALDGVGEGFTRLELVDEPIHRALHSKRVTTLSERNVLGAEWCAIPARDEAGSVEIGRIE